MQGSTYGQGGNIWYAAATLTRRGFAMPQKFQAKQWNE
jgi:hypothetical protein